MSRFTTSTLDGYLKLIRKPVDLAIGLLPRQRTGPAAAARVTVDRVDAGVRTLLGAALGDDALTEGARRQRDAADERQRAVELRRQAQEAEERTEQKLTERHEHASERREQARTRAASRRRQASRTETTRTRRAREVESERVDASRKQEERVDERIEAREAEARLPVLQEQAEGLAERQAALTQADEAERLGQSAARVKRQRKEP
jgi:hypothetical protein